MKKQLNYAIIPAYNEEKTIAEVINKVKKADIVPVVVDDNSKDRTIEIAKKNGAIVLKRITKRGKGEAIKAGIEYVLKHKNNAKNFVFVDADMQYDPGEAVSLIKTLENKKADLVIGFRDWSGVPFRHKLGNFVWRNTFNILFGVNLKDTNCGFMCVTKDAAETIKEVLHGGYIIENTILAHAIKNNLKIEQVPVKVTYKYKSGISRGIRMVGGVLLFIIKEGLKYRFGRK